jgi:hypothetical protein
LLPAANCPVGDATGAGRLRSCQPGVQSTPQLATPKNLASELPFSCSLVGA